MLPGFELSRDLGGKRFIEELLNIFPADCKEAGFEFDKNCGGSIVKHNLPSSLMIDSSTI